MSLTIVKFPNSVAIKSRDTDKIAQGKAILSIIPNTGASVPKGGVDGTQIGFTSGGENVGTVVNSNDVYLQDSPDGPEYQFTGTPDELLTLLNESYFLHSTTSYAPPTPIDMSYKFINTAADLPTPVLAANGIHSVITLKSGNTYIFAGQIAQGADEAVVTLPLDTVLYVESGAVILGWFVGTSILKTAGLQELGTPTTPQGYPIAFIEFEGSSKIENITIDGNGCNQQLIRFNNSPTSVHLWTKVEFKNGGLVGPTNSIGGVGFQMNTFANLVAETCRFDNTGFFNFSGLGSFSFEDVLFKCCELNFNAGLLGLSLFNFSLAWALQNGFALERCKGVINSPNGAIITNLLRLGAGNSKIEGIRVVDCNFDIVNGTDYIGADDPVNQTGKDQLQTYFRGNTGFHNNKVSVSAKTSYNTGSYPKTTLTQGNYADLIADLTGSIGAAIEYSGNLSRLFEITDSGGVSLIEYLGEKKRTFNFRVALTLSSSNNREIRLKAQADDQVSGFIDVPLSTGKATSNGTGRPETITSEFQISMQTGKVVKFQVANFTNNDDIETQIISVFSDELT